MPFTAALTLVVLNVITRYVFKTGISWSEEFATGCFVWTVFIGSAACYKHRAHVGADPIHFGAMCIVNIMIGGLTPPSGS